MQSSPKQPSIASNVSDYRQSIESLRIKLSAVLKLVKGCADVVDRINELSGLRDRVQSALPNPNQQFSTGETDSAARQKEQIAPWQKEIDDHCSPFLATEQEVRAFLDELQNVLNALPVEPPQLRDVRSEIVRLSIWKGSRSRMLGMKSSLAELQVIDQRLQEMQAYVAGERKPVDFEGLEQKKHDFSQYLENVNLTKRQHDCLSLKLEYEIPYRAIGDRLGISVGTVEEHIRRGKTKVDQARFKMKAHHTSGKKAE